MDKRKSRDGKHVYEYATDIFKSTEIYDLDDLIASHDISVNYNTLDDDSIYGNIRNGIREINFTITLIIRGRTKEMQLEALKKWYGDIKDYMFNILKQDQRFCKFDRSDFRIVKALYLPGNQFEITLKFKNNT